MHSFKQLVQLFEERLQQQTLFPNRLQTLYEPCHYFLGIGGKRVRPVLCLMGNELFGDLKEDAWHAAMGVELFHNFTLIHDDIMDKAPLRRGKQTLHERNGITAGILCGDVVSIYAYQHLAQVKNSLPQILHLFNTTAIEVCEGQQLDMDFENRDDVSIDEYIQMITLKTSVLLACSLKMGALIGGATDGSAHMIYEFGKNLGIAFQLKDDYLDAFGASEKTGKQIGGDILSNKKTYLALNAFQYANDVQKQQLAGWQNSDSTDKVNATLDLFRATKTDIACKEAIENYSKKAFACLENAAVQAKRKEPLRELATYLLERDY
ncbi:MAG TPA: polyprenyl synthetase family protein [Flavipsychrobacter sp.]|nr:polyprenyl synthetase family protein [Flavipsychrobacter sp.]